MSPGKLDALLLMSWTALTIVAMMTVIVIVIGTVSIVLRWPFTSRIWPIVGSMTLAIALFVLATVTFEKIESNTPAFRHFIGETVPRLAWDLTLAASSTLIAVGVGFLQRKLLFARAPSGWSGRLARLRDLGLIALLISAVLVQLRDRTGPAIWGLERYFVLHLWGVWALAMACPSSLGLLRRIGETTDDEGTGSQVTERPVVERFGRQFLVVYYWCTAVAIPITIVGFEIAERGAR